MPAILMFLLRLILVVAGLVFAASLALAFLGMLVAWTLRAGWARLTGKPVMPFIIRIDPRGGFDRMYRSAGQHEPARRGGAHLKPKVLDVTDVEPKRPV